MGKEGEERNKRWRKERGESGAGERRERGMKERLRDKEGERDDKEREKSEVPLDQSH